MKALFMITGPGVGGDSGAALNISKSLSKYGVESEFALDHKASGLLLKENGIKWHKTSIPQAGGHVATKLSLIKAGIKSIKALFEAVILFRKLHPDVVVGLSGGGAIIGCLAAKISNVPSVGILWTPADAKICPRITTTVACTESPLFKRELKNKNVHKSYSPIDPSVINGNKEKARKLMPEGYDETLPTILLSSGSHLFEKMALATSKLGKSGIHANIVAVGLPRNKKCLKYLRDDNIIFLGYINWIRDLFQLVDLLISSDDGIMVHEAIACGLPIITLRGVKYGRITEFTGIFKGALVEGNLETIDIEVKEALNNLDEMKENVSKYSKDVLESTDRIAEIIYNTI
jgi:UDP-N-acetylglucosamine--N-acetylmuramyl-(pentapeptide) pyrophosphoryl-undecaprenol N-acetylglucosamine transferase